MINKIVRYLIDETGQPDVDEDGEFVTFNDHNEREQLNIAAIEALKQRISRLEEETEKLSKKNMKLTAALFAVSNTCIEAMK